MALDALRNEESGEEYEEIDLEDFEYDEVSVNHNKQIVFLKDCSRWFQGWLLSWLLQMLQVVTIIIGWPFCEFWDAS